MLLELIKFRKPDPGDEYLIIDFKSESLSDVCNPNATIADVSVVRDSQLYAPRLSAPYRLFAEASRLSYDTSTLYLIRMLIDDVQRLVYCPMIVCTDYTDGFGNPIIGLSSAYSEQLKKAAIEADKIDVVPFANMFFGYVHFLAMCNTNSSVYHDGHYHNISTPKKSSQFMIIEKKYVCQKIR